MLTITADQLKTETEMTKIQVETGQYRIRRLDPSNFVIEKYVPPTKPDRKQETWAIVGYYGNLNDLTVGLVKYLVNISEGKDLLEQVVLLRQEIKSLEENISQLLTPYHGVKEGIREQSRK